MGLFTMDVTSFATVDGARMKYELGGDFWSKQGYSEQNLAGRVYTSPNERQESRGKNPTTKPKEH